jgi:hypothetical protein
VGQDLGGLSQTAAAERSLAHGRQELVKILDGTYIQGLQGSQAILGPVMKILVLPPHFGFPFFVFRLMVLVVGFWFLGI